MAAIAVNERFVKLAGVDQSIRPAVSGAALDAGTVISQGNDGRWVPGTAGENRAVCVETVLGANQPISPLKKGLLDVGDALQGRNPGPVFATPAGVLDDSATGNTRVATIEVGRGDLRPDGSQRRYLRFDL